MLRKLEAKDVEFKLIVHPEDMPVRGNALASGDDVEDKRYEDEIIARLDSGDVWAWCIVEVRAEWSGFYGRDTLGGCCYKDEADFKAPGGYYEVMKAQALDDLNERLEVTNKQLKPLRRSR